LAAFFVGRKFAAAKKAATTQTRMAVARFMAIMLISSSKAAAGLHRSKRLSDSVNNLSISDLELGYVEGDGAAPTYRDGRPRGSKIRNRGIFAVGGARGVV